MNKLYITLLFAVIIIPLLKFVLDGNYWLLYIIGILCLMILSSRLMEHENRFLTRIGSLPVYIIGMVTISLMTILGGILVILFLISPFNDILSLPIVIKYFLFIIDVYLIFYYGKNIIKQVKSMYLKVHTFFVSDKY